MLLPPPVRGGTYPELGAFCPAGIRGSSTCSMLVSASDLASEEQLIETI